MLFVRRAIKRTIDVCFSMLGLVFASPALLIIAIAIKITSAGPVLFIQERVGKDCKAFRMYKYRSMTYGAESQTVGRYISRNDMAITPVGRQLRRWALGQAHNPLYFPANDAAVLT